jgi:NAD(P)-dependent dehydrogenase (short-subunit alcohol dehydrogenase family)
MAHYELDGKVALVTGGGSGIGEACASALAASGATVVVADLAEHAAQRVSRTIADDGGVASPATIDVGDVAAVEALIGRIVAEHGRLDAAVNNAGVSGDTAPTGDYSIETWRRVIEINLTAVFYCCRYEIAAMLPSGGGAIVNMSSILGSVGFASAPAYVAAKHGVVGLTRAAAIDHAAAGIRVNAVGPGFVDTPLLAAADDAVRGGTGRAASGRPHRAVAGGRRPGRVAVLRRRFVRHRGVLHGRRRLHRSLSAARQRVSIARDLDQAVSEQSVERPSALLLVVPDQVERGGRDRALAGAQDLEEPAAHLPVRSRVGLAAAHRPLVRRVAGQPPGAVRCDGAGVAARRSGGADERTELHRGDRPPGRRLGIVREQLRTQPRLGRRGTGGRLLDS